MDLTKELYYNEGDSTTVSEVKELFKELLSLTWTIDIYRNGEPKEYNLKDLGWTIEYNNAKTSAGYCKWKWRRTRVMGSTLKKEIHTKRVQLSMHYLTQNLTEGKGAEWEEVIRHELAHAVDVEMRGKSNHDRVWKAVAHQMLSNGRRTFSSEELEDKKLSKYTLSCPDEKCDYTRASHKRRSATSRSHPCCNTCYDEGKGYVRLIQTQNY